MKSSIKTTSLAGPPTLDETESAHADYIDENILEFSHEVMDTDSLTNIEGEEVLKTYVNNSTLKVHLKSHTSIPSIRHHNSNKSHSSSNEAQDPTHSQKLLTPIMSMPTDELTSVPISEASMTSTA